MSGIVGIARPGERALAKRMLTKIAHRGPAGQAIISTECSTLGLAWTERQSTAAAVLRQEAVACDNAGTGHFAEARKGESGLTLLRDPLGIAPLYYGRTADGTLCLASEVKALRVATRDVRELPPGHRYDGRTVAPYFRLIEHPPIAGSPGKIAAEVRRRLATAVRSHVGDGRIGSWLSGGLDSSAIVALARPHVERLHTFAAGLPGAPDLAYARAVADFCGTEHHEVLVHPRELVQALPAVIYHLESFDALLVRSSITNYLVAQVAADYVPAALSGEGGDELFAGYAYLKGLDPAALHRELLDITGRLHNTALQRVDRCAAAHGMVAHVPFLDPVVADYALSITADLKLHDGVEKWILRQALAGLLPDSVLHRPKAKFWAGAGIGSHLADYAERSFDDGAFQRARQLPNGWVLNSKEELLYYSIFRQHFGDLESLSWMGRTKGAPVSA